MRREIVDFLQEKIPSSLWAFGWWFVPLSAVFLLPSGLIFTIILGKIGVEESGRLTQLLMLFSLFYGFAGGFSVLLLADFAEMPLASINKVKWLARLAVVAPVLTLLILFLIFSR
ncbi:MAG: hypothetical protein M3384_07385 [Acidobacteriota bacterium]|nr:hypothetical protein [Acidobacteriota bacterium]